MLQIVLCLLSISPIEPKVENLLEISANYNQVPLCVDDLLHLSVSSEYGSRLQPILNKYNHHSDIDLPDKMGEKVSTLE